MTDTKSFEHALAFKVKQGTMLKMDGDFTCMKEGAVRTVKEQEGSEALYVDCAEGKHFLDGQLENGRYVGMEIVR